MSATSDVNAPSLSTAGFEDGLGRRSIRFDREVGGILECLHVRPELRAFEPVLKATSTRIAALGDERFARTFGFEREANSLIILSELPSGERLADIIDAHRGEEAGVSALDAAVGLLLQVMPALAKVHGIGISHGTLAPGRMIVTPTAQVVLLDAIYGTAAERLAFSRQTLWASLGVLAAPSAGPVRLDARADIAQVALCAASLALGRSLSPAVPPDLHALVSELSDIAQIRAGERFGEAVRSFFQTALPRASQTALSAEALCADVSRLADFIGVENALAALAELVRSAPIVERAVADFAFDADDDDDQDEEDGFDEPVRAHIPQAPEPEPEPEPIRAVAVEPRPESVAPATLPAEFLPVSAPALVEPPTPRELAAPTPPPPAPPPPLPPLVSPAARETFEIATSVPAAPEPPAWIPPATPAPWTAGAGASVPPSPAAPAPPAPPASWTVATPIAPQPVPTVFASPLPPAPVPAPPMMTPGPIGIAPPPVLPPPPAPINIAPPAPLVAPPAASPSPASVQLQPPQKLKLKSDGPAGYAPARSTSSMAHPVEPVSRTHSGPFLDRLGAEQEQRRFPWKFVAAAVVVLVIGGFAGRDYLMGRTASAPPPTEPAAPARPAETPKVGVLDINSLPSGARVVLDGDEVGVTPLKLESVSPGRHTVVVSTDTASVRRTVRIEAGKTVSLDLSVFAGWVAVFSPIRLHISEEGRALGTTDSGRILLPPGRHVLTLTNTEYGYSGNETVEIVAGEERAINVTPKGTVNVNAQPWAEVWVDGQRVGETPLANLQVALGTREFVFKHPQYGERKTVATVTSTPSAISVDFTRQN